MCYSCYDGQAAAVIEVFLFRLRWNNNERC
jgi:hypothetical protein